MKNKHFSFIPLLFICCSLVSFKQPGKGATAGSYNLIYIDNSGTLNGSASISNEMQDLIAQRIDSFKLDKSAKIQLFLSNNFKPEFAKNADEAKKIIGKLNSGYTALPTSVADITFLRNYVFNDNLENVQSINISFFVSEYYLQNDLLAGNAGLLINFFAKELQYQSKVDPDNVRVTIYYPKDSKPAVAVACTTFQQMQLSEKIGAGAFKTKIHFLFKPM